MMNIMSVVFQGDTCLGIPRTHADWSVTWEAVGAIGTIVAAAIPTWLYFVERKSRISAERELQVARDRQLILDRESQARRIVLAVQYNHDGDSRTAFPIVQNYSDAPIFEITLERFQKNANQKSISGSTIQYGAVLEPGAKMKIIGKVRVEQSTDNVTSGIRIRFTDVHRRKWTTYDNGRMKLLRDAVDEKLGVAPNLDDDPDPADHLERY